MLNNFLSRYRPRYLRSLAYLLQASEYHILDYLKWFWSVKDFSSVEKRKALVKTAKARLVLVLLWLSLLVLVVLGIWGFLALSSSWRWLFAIVFIFILPYLLAYGILIPLLIIQFVIQKPVEYFILKRAEALLKKHKGIKIAIAGSFGKTSMREILKTVLSAGMVVGAPPHSYNTPLGIAGFIKTLKGDEQVLIFEFGEYYAGDIKKLCQLVHPDIGIITGVNEAHLEKFKTLDKTVATIFELADYLKGKPLYVNGESALTKKRAEPSQMIYGRDGVEKWHVEDPKADLDETSFLLTDGIAKLQARSGLLGLHQIGPLSAAAHIAMRLGLAPDVIERGLAATKPFEHRMEKSIDASGVITLDDSYNGNPDGVAAVIAFLASIKDHRRFYVTPGLVEMGNRTEAVQKTIGKLLAAAGIEKVVLMKNSVTPFIAEGLRENSYRGEIVWFDDALTAFAALPLLTVRGDVVLLQNDWPDQYR